MAQRGGDPQYRLISQALLKRIGDGEFAPGALLPTESALGEQFKVSRITVRAALAELEHRGIVSRRPGVGTRVESATARGTFVHAGDTVEDVMQMTRGLAFRQLAARAIVATDDTPAGMRLAAGQRFVHVTGMRRAADGQPLFHSDHYVPEVYAHVVRKFDGATGSVVQLLSDECREEVAQIRQELDATRPTRAQSRTLDAAAGTPCLRTRRWYYNGAGTLLLASTGLFPAGRWVYSSLLRRAPAEG